MVLQTRLLTPVDVLNFRGNKGFGEEGHHGESQMPPWPSIFAGALRSGWLAQERVDMAAFSQNRAQMAQPLASQLGSPANPGSFRLNGISLARHEDGRVVDCFMPLPADAVVLGCGMEYLRPRVIPALLANSGTTARQATLCAPAQKPETGHWLNSRGIAAYLTGKPLERSQLVPAGELWQTDERLGIALDRRHRTAQKGLLYTTESVSLCCNTGFLVTVAGADQLPATGMVRLGGDGRAATVSTPEGSQPAEPDWQLIEKEKRFRVLFTTPALLAGGWLPGKNTADTVDLADGSGNLVCAANPRPEVVSGFDLANWRPKPAERVLARGSVFWIENFTGSVTSLQTMMNTGLAVDNLDPQRRAEGFNNIAIANWAQ